MEAAKLFTFRRAETLQQSSSIANLILTKNAFHRIIGPRSGVPPIFIFSVNVGNRTDFKLAACQDACIASFEKKRASGD
jgi:hypothetical protein